MEVGKLFDKNIIKYVQVASNQCLQAALNDAIRLPVLFCPLAQLQRAVVEKDL
jgi:hypothetical protein